MKEHESHRWTRRIPKAEIDFLIHVLPQRHIIFVTNPKVASSTMKSTLWRWHLQDPDHVFARGKIHNKKESPFRSPGDFGFCGFMSNINSPEYLRICFVRNPYTRLLSLYMDKVLKKNPRLMKDLGLPRDDAVTFPALVETIGAQTWYQANRHYRAQTENLLWGDIQYDFVGKLEYFADELDRLAVDHDIDLRNYLSIRQRHATGAEQHLYRFYTDELQARVHELYRSDFDAFGYDYDLPDLAHVMALARRGPRFAGGKLVVDLLLDPRLPDPVAVSQDGRGGGESVLELRRNGRRVAPVFARERSGSRVRIEARRPLAAIGDVVYSFHGTASGETLATMVHPAFSRARRVVGAVENRERPQIRGWILDPACPERRRRIAIHADGRLHDVIRANRLREDIARWKGTDGYHGFLWHIPEAMAAVNGTRFEVFDADTGRPLQGSPLWLEDRRVVATRQRGH